MERLLSSGDEQEVLLRLQAAGGGEVEVAVTLSSFGEKGASGDGASGVLGVGVDITKLSHSASAALQEAHELKRLIDCANGARRLGAIRRNSAQFSDATHASLDSADLRDQRHRAHHRVEQEGDAAHRALEVGGGRPPSGGVHPERGPRARRRGAAERAEGEGDGELRVPAVLEEGRARRDPPQRRDAPRRPRPDLRRRRRRPGHHRAEQGEGRARTRRQRFEDADRVGERCAAARRNSAQFGAIL